MSNALSPSTASRAGEPTDAPPGSPRKIRVLTERASRREALFHPRDNLKRLPANQPEEEGPEEVFDELDIELAS